MSTFATLIILSELHEALSIIIYVLSHFLRCIPMVAAEDPPESLVDMVLKESEKLVQHSQLLENDLFQLSGIDRLHLCFAAREAIRLLSTYMHNVPVLLSQKMRKAETFDVQHNAISGKKKYVLLPCHSFPTMYVGQQVGENSQPSNSMDVFLISNGEVLY